MNYAVGCCPYNNALTNCKYCQTQNYSTWNCVILYVDMTLTDFVNS